MPTVLDEIQSFAPDAFHIFCQCSTITCNIEVNIRNNNVVSGCHIVDIPSHTLFLLSSDKLSVQVFAEFHKLVE